MLATTDGYDVFETALASARKLWGEDSLEPDYAAVQNAEGSEEHIDAIFDRLREHGDAKRMLEVLPKLNAESAKRLEDILMARQPLPVAEAQAVVAGPDVLAAGVAAHLLGRANATSMPRRWPGLWSAGGRSGTRNARRRSAVASRPAP